VRLDEPYDYEPQPGDTVVYRGKQWIVVSNPNDPGGGFLLHNDQRWFYANELDRHKPNYRNPKFEYSMLSHMANKGFDLDDWEAVYRFACSYFNVDTTGWLDNEVEHARAVRKYKNASRSLKKEIFPHPPDSFVIESPRQMFYKSDAIAAELARRGIFDPDGPIAGQNKLAI
jgi:hypothetical protein